MQSSITGHVSRSEWRWVVLVGMTVLGVLTLPLLMVQPIQLADTERVFMGLAHDYWNGAASVSRMIEGANGQFLVQFQHTSEYVPPALIELIYPLLGQIADSLDVSPLGFFHAIRIGATLLMYFAIYQLAASIWVKVRTRRIFFVMSIVSSGFGWIFALSGADLGTVYPDFAIPQSYPTLSAAVNVHYPLAIACVALIVSVMVPVFRPGETADPQVDNGGALVFLLSLVLTLLYPEALLPLFIATLASILINGWQKRQIVAHDWRWGLWFIVPALPMLVLLQNMINANAQLNIWLDQRNTMIPSPFGIIVGLGLGLIIAAPGMYRAVRRFESDGDRFMILWCLSMLVLLYWQLNPYFLLGLMLPVAYFAARSTEDFWFRYIKHRNRSRWYVAITPVLLIGSVIWLIAPFVTLANPNSSAARELTLEVDYVTAIQWLDTNASADDVILSAPQVGLWIPTQSNLRVVYGHPHETLLAVEKLRQVREWYGSVEVEACHALIDRNRVAYVLYGGREAALGDAPCLNELTLVETIGDIQIYATSDANNVTD